MNRLTEWIIHKLGGYTGKEIILPLPSVKIYRNEKPIKRICAVQEMDIQCPIWLKEGLRKKLTDGLAKELTKQYFNVVEEKIGINWVYSVVLEFIEQKEDKSE